MEGLSRSGALSQANAAVEAELREAAVHLAALPRVIDATQFDYENLCAEDAALYVFELDDGDRLAASGGGAVTVDKADARAATAAGKSAVEGLPPGPAPSGPTSLGLTPLGLTPLGPALQQVQRCVLALLKHLLSHTGVEKNCQRWRVAGEMQSLDEVMLARAQRVPFASTLFAPRLLDVKPGTPTDRQQHIIRRAEALRHAEWPALQAERVAAYAALAVLKQAAERDPAHADAAFHAELKRMKGLLDECGELVDLLRGAIPPQASPEAFATAPTEAYALPDSAKLEVLWCPPATTRRSWMMRRRHCVVVG